MRALLFLGAALASSSIAYLLLALRAVLRFKKGEPRPGDPTPPVTVLKPICGAEPGLYECLRSFCEQDYPEYQLVLGVSDPDDAALPILRRLTAEFPGRDISVLVGGSRRGSNPKVSTLINMDRVSKYRLVMVSDSDVKVGADCLRALASSFADSRTGAVTCLYLGVSSASWASRLGALYINDWFIPSALVDSSLREVDFCFGPVSVVRREALDAIGGFSSLADYLADDFMMGQKVKHAGFKVEMSSYPVETLVEESDLPSLFAHEIRWARTVRTCRPLDHLLSLVTFSLPLAALLLMVSAPAAWTLTALGVMIGLRLAIHEAVRRRLGSPGDVLWLVPLRECLCFLIWALSLWGNTVRWRGRDFKITAQGTLVEAGGSRRLGPIFAAFSGLVLTGVLVSQTGFGSVMSAMVDAGWTAVSAITLFNLLTVVLCGFAWRSLLGGEAACSLGLIVWARYLRSSISEMMPISGELIGVRVLSLHGMRGAAAAAATVVDMTAELFSQLVFTALGILLLAIDGRGGRLTQWTFVGLLLAVPPVVGFVIAQRRGMFRWLEVLGRRLASPDLPESGELHEEIQAIYGRRAGLAAAFSWHLAAWLIGAGEAWLALRFLGAPLGISAVLIVESLSFALRSAAFFVPGALGIQEGGYIGLCAVFGLGPEIGLALSLLKRGREALLAAPALLAWQLLEGRSARGVSPPVAVEFSPDPPGEGSVAGRSLGSR